MRVRSPLPPLDSASLDAHFSTFALARGRAEPDKVALIDAAADRQLTFGELTAAIDAVAGGLRAQGLAPGDIVALCAFNCIEYVVAAHAVWRAGGVVVTVNPLFTVGEMHTELVDAGARVCIAAAEVSQRVAASARLASIERVYSLEALPTAAPPPAPSAEPDATALILYSSGTTGLPKGVELTHRNLNASLLQLYAGDLARPTDVLLALSPFFHVVGLHGVMNLGLFAGSGIVILARYDLPRLLGAIQRYAISSIFITPPVLTDLAKHPAVDGYDVSSLRSILCAAAPLGADLEQMAADRLGCVVRQGYGMTEASGPVSTNLVDQDGQIRRRGSVGQLVPSTECKIVDLATGAELEPGDAGEVLVRGPQVMKGYLGQPEATRISLEADGWLHTGDVGYADAEGYLYIVDRVKEIIKYKAYQVAPAELEAVLMTHAGVRDAAVVPVPDPESGEIPKALVVRSADNVAADELLAYVAERVAPYKKVRRIEFVESIPKSPSGKILRRLLVERERAAAAQSAQAS